MRSVFVTFVSSVIECLVGRKYGGDMCVDRFGIGAVDTTKTVVEVARVEAIAVALVGAAGGEPFCIIDVYAAAGAADASGAVGWLAVDGVECRHDRIVGVIGWLAVDSVECRRESVVGGNVWTGEIVVSDRFGVVVRFGVEVKIGVIGDSRGAVNGVCWDVGSDSVDGD